MSKSTWWLILLFIVLVLLSSGLWLYEAKYFVGSAKALSADFSPGNSYLFVSPLQAKANSQEKIRVSAFILNNQGLGVGGKSISLQFDPNLTVETIQGQTDSFGKAIFDVTSNKAGEYWLQIQVNAANLPQKAHLSFY